MAGYRYKKPKEIIPKAHVTTSIRVDIWEKAQSIGLSWQEALEFGILFKFAEKEDFGFPENSLNLKIERLMQLINEKSQEIEDLKKKIPKEFTLEKIEDIEKPKTAEEDIKEVFGKLNEEVVLHTDGDPYCECNKCKENEK